MGFRKGPSAADSGLKKIVDTGTDTALTLTDGHSGTIFLVGGAGLAVVLPAAADLQNGWNAMFVGFYEDSGTLTDTTTITGAGTNELIGHTVTGLDGGSGAVGNRQLSTEGVFDSVKLHSIGLKGDWVEITNIGSNYFVTGDSRIVNALPVA